MLLSREDGQRGATWCSAAEQFLRWEWLTRPVPGLTENQHESPSG